MPTSQSTVEEPAAAENNDTVSTETALEVVKSQVDIATGAGDATTEVVVAKTPKKKRRPARVQKEPGTVQDQLPQSGTVFNIWYLKWSGGDKDDAQYSQRKSEGRCVIATDAGYTKADKVAAGTQPFFCLYFARGLCTRGKHCEYLHRLPRVTDMFPPNLDCFGRDKFADYRDDMGGVGSFLRQNRTLYVGRISTTENVEEAVARNFAEWGEIERTRVLNNRGVAFVTYMNETSAQFAKEAMAHQSLTGLPDEVLNVRWATEDPNPLSQVREKRRLEEQAAEAIRKLLPADYVAELEGRDPDAKKRRKEQSSLGLEGYEAPDDIWFARGENAINPNAKTIVSSTNRNTTTIHRLTAHGEEQPDDGGHDAREGEGDAEAEEPVKQLEAPPAAGLFSASSLAALKAVNLTAATSAAVPAPAPGIGGGGLGLVGDYESDDD